jgi:DNA-binding response OmpR family regulator
VLVVDDDPKIVATVTRYLEHGGFAAVVALDGPSALALARRERPDLIVLDRMLPGLDGASVCRVLRAESRVPIIMLTARATEEDRLEGLDLGADDYVVKPFSPRELIARIRAVLRRNDASRAAADDEPTPIHVGEITLDLARHELRVRGAIVGVTAAEFRLLAALAAAPGRVFTRRELLDRGFDWTHEASERVIDVHIKNLRQKIERDRDRPLIIRTVVGVGYRLARDHAHSHAHDDAHDRVREQLPDA